MTSRNSNELPPAVVEMAQISLSSNIYPTIWFQKLTFENGKPDLNSILILDDLCYWHRATEIRDERSGAIVAYKKNHKRPAMANS